MKELIRIESMEPKNRLRIEFMVGNCKCWRQSEMLMTKGKI